MITIVSATVIGAICSLGVLKIVKDFKTKKKSKNQMNPNH